MKFFKDIIKPIIAIAAPVVGGLLAGPAGIVAGMAVTGATVSNMSVDQAADQQAAAIKAAEEQQAAAVKAQEELIAKQEQAQKNLIDAQKAAETAGVLTQGTAMATENTINSNSQSLADIITSKVTDATFQVMDYYTQKEIADQQLKVAQQAIDTQAQLEREKMASAEKQAAAAQMPVTLTNQPDYTNIIVIAIIGLALFFVFKKRGKL